MTLNQPIDVWKASNKIQLFYKKLCFVPIFHSLFLAIIICCKWVFNCYSLCLPLIYKFLFDNMIKQKLTTCVRIHKLFYSFETISSTSVDLSNQIINYIGGVRHNKLFLNIHDIYVSGRLAIHYQSTFFILYTKVSQYTTSRWYLLLSDCSMFLILEITDKNYCNITGLH